MHKKVKHIIATSLVVGTISCILPSNNFILGTIEANASTYRYAVNGELSSLTITRSTGSEVTLLDTYAGSEVSLSEKKDYYIDLTGADGFNISADVQGSGYVVKVFNSADKTEKGNDIGDYVKIDSASYEDVYLRTYKSEDAYKEAYGNGDVTDCENTYIIHVRKPAAGEIISDTELDKDYAYLKSIYLSNGGYINNFTKDQYSYNVNIADNVGTILVRATPENDDDVVDINGQSVEEKDDFEKTIGLDKGNNTIKIDVKGNDDEETYTLNVYRGNDAANTSNNQSSSLESSTGTFNSWQRVNGKWQYIDGTGQALKNTWWFDKNTGKNYYLKEDGYRATGWFSDDNKWYYFNANGEMQIGWICLNSNWYYLNKSGAMQIGWLEDSSGNWYYLDSNGTMKTGWVEGSDGKSYYLDSSGKMITNPISDNL